MKRKKISLNLDPRLLEALSKVSLEQNISQSRYVENLLLQHFKVAGYIPLAEKELGENRGGDFKSEKYKKLKTNTPSKKKPCTD